jgi:hypothetical protein
MTNANANAAQTPSADPRTRYAEAITAYRRAERRINVAAQHRPGLDCWFPSISAERFCWLARVESGITGELTPAEWADAAERVAAQFCRSADEFCQLVA